MEQILLYAATAKRSAPPHPVSLTADGMVQGTQNIMMSQHRKALPESIRGLGGPKCVAAVYNRSHIFNVQFVFNAQNLD